MAKIGWAAGMFIGSGEYLTVIGSAYDAYGLVFADRADAEARAERLHERQSAASQPDPAEIVVRRVRTVYHSGVTLTQTAYRVLPEES